MIGPYFKLAAFKDNSYIGVRNLLFDNIEVIMLII